MQQQKKDLVGKLAIGVTGIALTAGAIATAAALMNKKNRKALKNGVDSAAKKINQAREVWEEGKDAYKTAIQHTVGMAKKVKKTSKK